MAARGKGAAFLAVWRALRGATRPGAPGLMASLRAVPRLVVATLRGRYHGTTPGQLGVLALGVVYVVSPIDLLPDFLPLIGIADDAVVAAWLVGRLLMETADFLRWERNGAPEAPGRPGPVIDGQVLHD
ncbi:YkvA family protein [Angustibacter sp. McL0619]|uniref:YkvA family protein n=1 Tax=Angustibacter sp. McL0619 TaxID=3415676 RepID=UPI003CFBB36F